MAIQGYKLYRLRLKKFSQLLKSKLVALLIKKKTNYPLNEPENHPTHVIMIFYGWTGK